ncbi:MAG TPA: N-6 DNA methylase [Anaerolineae bacterium]|nr:N-6 DNA methylase [Anaerolineae bacterium]
MTRKDLQQIELERQAEQARLDGLKTAMQRNEMGQYATPFPLALKIMQFVRDNWLTAAKDIRFLDPAVGTGAFVSALLHAFDRKHLRSITGIELDPQIASAADKLWSKWGLKVIEADFTRLPFPASPDANFLVANPPYVRHHHLDREAKPYLQQKAQVSVGLKVNGLAGLYCYFLLIAHRWLADDGIGVWLIPSEFMDVNYGKAIKRYLTEQVTLHHVHRFDPEDVQFDDALVSSTVLIFQKRIPSAQHEAIFSVGSELRTPRRSKHIRQQQLADVSKWTSLPDMPLRYVTRNVERLNATICIGDLFDIRRGLATGANEFFILTRQLAREKGLPDRFLRPILPSPRYLTDDVILAGSDGYPVIEPLLVLLDCNLAESEIRYFPPLRVYLEEGKSRGFADRYIPSHRSPWYKQEFRPAAPIVCSYMSRGRSGTSGIRFFRNYSQATAPNVYLMLYPSRAIQRAVEEDPHLLDSLFELLKRASQEHLLYEGRTYGGGLNKIEPNELARVPLPNDPILEHIGSKPRQFVLLEKKQTLLAKGEHARGRRH